MTRGSSWVALVDLSRLASRMDGVLRPTWTEGAPFAADANPITPQVDVVRIGGSFNHDNVYGLTPNVRGAARATLLGRSGEPLTRKLSLTASKRDLAAPGGTAEIWPARGYAA